MKETSQTPSRAQDLRGLEMNTQDWLIGPPFWFKLSSSPMTISVLVSNCGWFKWLINKIISQIGLTLGLEVEMGVWARRKRKEKKKAWSKATSRIEKARRLLFKRAEDELEFGFMIKFGGKILPAKCTWAWWQRRKQCQRWWWGGNDGCNGAVTVERRQQRQWGWRW